MSEPLSHPFDLNALSDRGAEVVLVPTASERQAIAAWLDVSALERLSATIHLSRRGDDVYVYAASFTADVVQACVVTLEPVPSHLSQKFSREYRFIPRFRRDRLEVMKTKVQIDAEAAEAPEELSSSMLDLAAPVLEELSLSADPYPRAPGVNFVPKEEKKPSAESPFAVLAKLKAKAPAPKAKRKLKPKETAKKLKRKPESS